MMVLKFGSPTVWAPVEILCHLSASLALPIGEFSVFVILCLRRVLLFAPHYSLIQVNLKTQSPE